MKAHLYLSLIPESLIVSHLPPEAFGAYFANGTLKDTRGQALFFEVDPALLGDAFNLPEGGPEAWCKAHTDGRPRKSHYLSIYRVIERVPLEALGALYLTTADGRVLGLEADAHTQAPRGYYLYQELSPITPRVVSVLPPCEFAAFLTRPDKGVYLPAIVFCEMKLGALAHNPDAEETDNLPYDDLAHVRHCLQELRDAGDKISKTVMRQLRHDISFRMVKGFYVGRGAAIRAYPMPELSSLESEHYAWWRSARLAYGQ
ncbi:hypothetical protein KKB55_16255 [Myxococcota bacterium]|nr:hypothetical protein [Myxococcota bacterium]MBU1899295.1 hypothetical protein [Myxococcota bacterium]